MPARQCLYEQLGVPQNADDADIRRAYRQAALQYHPDKNRGEGEEEAAELFKGIQHAYEVLSDPHERAWYDSHRESILRGRDVGGGDSGDDRGAAEATSLDLFALFTSTSYSGFDDDDADSFYGVFSEVFNTLAAEERSAGMSHRMPSFGNGSDDWPAVRDFYRAWEGFASRKTFAFADKWNLADAPNRDYRRAMERENKRERAKVKKEFNDLVRDLCLFVKKRDPRVKARKDAETEKKVEREDAARARKQQDSADRKARAAETRAQRDAALEEDGEELDRILEELAMDEKIDLKQRTRGHRGRRRRPAAGLSDEGESEGDGAADVGNDSEIAGQSGEEVFDKSNDIDGALSSGESNSEEAEDDLYCVACRKMFRTVGQRVNHEQSRKHVAAAARLRKQLLEEDAQFASGEPETPPKGSLAEGGELQAEASTDGAAGISDDPAPLSKKARKKARDRKRLEEQAGLDVDMPSEDPSGVFGNVSNGQESSVAESARVQRKAKRKEKRKEKAAAVNGSGQSGEGQAADFRCNVCGNEFASRSKLFTHIKEKGHALAEPGPGPSGRRRR